MKTRRPDHPIAAAATALGLSLVAAQATASTIIVEDYVLNAARAPYQQKCQSSWGGGMILSLIHI